MHLHETEKLPDSYELRSSWKIKTYSGSDYNDLWAAIFNACELFRIIAPPVGKHFGFTYNQEEDTNMMEYLNWVKASCKNDK